MPVPQPKSSSSNSTNSLSTVAGPSNSTNGLLAVAGSSDDKIHPIPCVNKVIRTQFELF